jgi:hypothetical protein
MENLKLALGMAITCYRFAHSGRYTALMLAGLILYRDAKAAVADGRFTTVEKASVVANFEAFSGRVANLIKAMPTQD